MGKIKRHIVTAFFVTIGHPMEIHNEIVNVLAHAAPSRTVVYKGALEFKRVVGALKTNPAVDALKVQQLQLSFKKNYVHGVRRQAFESRWVDGSSCCRDRAFRVILCIVF